MGTTRVDIPGKGIVEFPESMTREQITAAIRKLSPPMAENPMDALGQHWQSLEARMARASGKPVTSLPARAAQTVKEMAIPAVTTAIGGATGGLPGAMTGSALGETLNQALDVYGTKSVIPEVNQPDLTRIGIAAAAPAVVPALVKGAQGVKKVSKAIADNVSAPRFAKKWLRENVGSYADDAQRALLTPETIPSYPATAAEKLATTPAGSVIQSHQKITARTPGGISSEFAGRKVVQEMKIAEALANRDKVTDPLREAALDAANASGSLRVQPLIATIDERLAAPETTGSPYTQRAFESIKRHLGKMADKTGRIDARALYQFKKEGVAQVVDTAMRKANPRFSDAFRAKELIGLNKAIDDAIETAAGGGWKHYLGEYSKRSAITDALVQRWEDAANPLQAATLPGGVNMATSSTQHFLPNWLSTPITGTKWLAQRYASYLEPKIDRTFADLYLNPSDLAAVLQQTPTPNLRQQAIMRALLQAQGPATAGIATQQ